MVSKEIISEHTWSSSQAVHMETIERVSRGLLNAIIKTSLKRDSYDHQSYAKVYVLDGYEWRLLYSIPYPRMACVIMDASYVQPVKVIRLLGEDKINLLKVTNNILFNK